jgi:PAS domain S-box-containing protein
MESRLLRRSGTLVWVASSVSPLRNKDGGFQQATAIIVDVAERKRVERRLAAIIASSNDAILAPTLA